MSGEEPQTSKQSGGGNGIDMGAISGRASGLKFIMGIVAIVIAFVCPIVHLLSCWSNLVSR